MRGGELLKYIMRRPLPDLGRITGVVAAVIAAKDRCCEGGRRNLHTMPAEC